MGAAACRRRGRRGVRRNRALSEDFRDVLVAVDVTGLSYKEAARVLGRRHIVGEAFASTIVNGNRTRVDLNRIGVWFADPVGDDVCLGAMSPTTPFDGDNSAGV